MSFIDILMSLICGIPIELSLIISIAFALIALACVI
jgi:hypothetical protein